MILRRAFLFATLWFSFALRLTAEPAWPQSTFAEADFLFVPLRFHLLSATNLDLVHTTLVPTDIERILGKMNRIWAQAGIHFYAESILREDARYRPELDEAVRQNDRQGLLALRPDQSMGTNFLHIYYLKKMAVNGIHFREANFVKDTAALRPVEGGIDEPLPRVSSHELGHAFGLPHRQNTTNLMASGTTGLWLNEEEIKIARGIAGKMPWTESVAIINQRLKDAPSGKEAAHSKVWRERLAEIAFLLKGRKNE
jgi:hypothetical protein